MSKPDAGKLSWLHIVRSGLLLVLSAVLGGAIGLLMALGIFFAISKNFFLDRADKHGISEKTSSRFGGPMVLLGAFAFGYLQIAIEKGSPFLGVSDFSSYVPNYLWLALAAGGIGFWEDYAERLSPLIRLQLLFLVVGIHFFLIGGDLPRVVVFNELSQFLNHPLTVGLGMTICVVGFINAGNVADGANGLLSSIAVVVFLIGYLETGTMVLLALLVSTLVFSLFNMATGSIFLGDSGAYFLSASMAFVCADLYMRGGLSIWFFACFSAYPCIELVRTIYVRWDLGRPLLKADNIHLHNMLFERLKEAGFSSLVGNTTTGLLLATCSVIGPLTCYLFEILPFDSIGWFFLFNVYCFAHLLLAQYLGLTSRKF